MNIRKLAYSLAVVMLSYDVLSILLAARIYGRFADLSTVYNFLWAWNPLYVPVRLVIAIACLIIIFWAALISVEVVLIMKYIPKQQKREFLEFLKESPRHLLAYNLK